MSFARHPEEGDPAAIAVGPLRRRAHPEALARLRRRPDENLFLIDVVHQARTPRPGEPRPELLAAMRAGSLVGLAAVRPTVALEAALEPDVLEALAERLVALQPSGLVRSPAELVPPLWERLARMGRRALVDRPETAFRVRPGELVASAAPAGLRLRAARADDLDALVAAARASLREEGRPDPFDGDPRGFRFWVEARRGRALVGELDGRVAFVGYADVKLPEGWLLQGVYTEPDRRRRGLAAAGVSALCAAAFGSGARHVQLSVVEGNRAAEQLYARLGFRPFAALRTLLYV